MDKLIEFLQKEVPSNAEDLNNSINNILEIIDRTRATLSDKYMAMAKNYFKDKNSYEIISNFENAEKQLNDFQHKLHSFLDNDIENVITLDNVLIEENDNEDVPEDENEEIEECEGKIDYKKYLVDNTKPYSLSSDFENTTPHSFSFRGETYKVKTYKEMWLKLCEILYNKDTNEFTEIATWGKIRGRKKAYIAYKNDNIAKNITTPLRFMNTGIILEGTTSTTQKIKIITQMLEFYKISPSTVKVYLKSDRHPKHGQEPIGKYLDKTFDYKAEIKKNLKSENNKSEENNSDVPTGKRIYDYLQDYFKNSDLSYDIKNLLDKDWCKETFNISYPLLKEIDELKDLKEQTIPEGKKGAYYAQSPVLHINNKSYIIYMQWNNKMHRSKIENWISEHPPLNFNSNSKIPVYILPKLKIKTCPKCGNKTEREILYVIYHTDIVDINNQLFTRRCKTCEITYIADTIFKSYTRSKEIENINVNFIKQDT